MPFEARGTVGGLYVGYHRAASFSEWGICRREEFIGDTVTVLTGQMAQVDSFWIGHLSRAWIRLCMGKCWWWWDHIEIQSVDPLLIFLDGDPRSLPQE